MPPTYLQASFRRVRFLRLASAIAARLAARLTTSFACVLIRSALSRGFHLEPYPFRLPLRLLGCQSRVRDVVML